MPIPQRALELESFASEWGPGPRLGEAYELLVAQWRSGVRDRELALHLAFAAWYILLEPPHLTVGDRIADEEEDLRTVFQAAHDWIDPAATNHAQALWVFGLMAAY